MEKMGRVATNLMTCDDWNIMIWHAKKHKVDVIQLKTDDKVSFTPCYHAIIIKLTCYQYIQALHDRLMGTSDTRSTKRKKGVLRFNLDGNRDGNEEDDFKNHVMEAKWILLEKMRDCSTCGRKVPCKVNRHGVHVKFTFAMLHGWATSRVFKFS